MKHGGSKVAQTGGPLERDVVVEDVVASLVART